MGERVPTFEELYEGVKALPETIIAEILEDGRIICRCRPDHQHNRAATKLLLAVSEIEDRGGGWFFFREPDLRLPGGRLLVPDVAGWRASDPTFLDDAPITRVPDWVAEVSSDATAAVDRNTKLPMYVAAGVADVWLLRPSARTIETFAGGRLRARVAPDVASARLHPFGDVDLPLDRMWGPRRRRWLRIRRPRGALLVEMDGEGRVLRQVERHEDGRITSADAPAVPLDGEDIGVDEFEAVWARLGSSP